MKVTVTQEHINKGQKLNPTGCPIHHAILEQYNQNWYVGNSEAHDQYSKKYCWLPKNAQQFIVDFDINPALVRPFEFEMEVR